MVSRTTSSLELLIYMLAYFGNVRQIMKKFALENYHKNVVPLFFAYAAPNEGTDLGLYGIKS